MKITQKALKKRVLLVTQKLYSSKYYISQKMSPADVPIGSLIVVPNTMSKKDFNSFLLKWVICMEKYIKKKDKIKKLKSKK